MYQLKKFVFPKDFHFGVADADLQVIGEEYTQKQENSELSMWTHFAQNSGKVYKNQTPLPGIDRYNKWQEDASLIQNLGVKHYRTSVSMSRVMTKDKEPNMKAILWYKRYFEDLKSRGISINVTLYHWELPQYLSAIGGWKNRDTIDYVVEHSKIVYTYLNEYIDEYYILNEPFQSTFFSYHTGEHAPGETDLKGSLLAVHHILLAQGRIFNELNQLDSQLKLGTVFNPSVTYAASSKPEDIQAAQYAFGYHTSMFTDPTYLGEYPQYMMDIFGDSMPRGYEKDMSEIKIGEGLSTFGVNYYRGKIVESDNLSDVKFREVRYPQGITNGLGWPVHVAPTYPESFYDLLTELYHRYGSYGMKAISVTENGTCWDDKINSNGEVDDEFRIFYIREHLKQVQKAILAGVPISGYYVWTLMDNYEWELGYKQGSNFGIVHVDRDSMKRIPKKSYYWYNKVIETRSIHDL